MYIKPARAFADHVLDVAIDMAVDPRRLVMKERGSNTEAAARHELMLRLHEDHRSKSEVGRLLGRWPSAAGRGIEKAKWARERAERLRR